MPVLLQNPIVNCLQILVGHFQARPVRPVRPFPLTRLPSPQPHIWTAWPSTDGLQSSQSGLARCEHCPPLHCNIARKYQTPLLCFVFAIAADPKLLLTRVEAKQRGSVLQRIAQEWGPRHTVNKQLSASSNFIGRSETEGEGFWGVVCRSHIAEIVLNLPCSPRAASCLASGGICKCISNAAPQYDCQATRIKEGGKLDKHSCAK